MYFLIISMCAVFVKDLSGNPPRMSYAQAAQHHKEAHAHKEKQNDNTSTPSSTTAGSKNTNNTSSGNNSNNSTNSGRVQGDNARDSKGE